MSLQFFAAAVASLAGVTAEVDPGLVFLSILEICAVASTGFGAPIPFVYFVAINWIVGVAVWLPRLMISIKHAQWKISALMAVPAFGASFGGVHALIASPSTWPTVVGCVAILYAAWCFGAEQTVGPEPATGDSHALPRDGRNQPPTAHWRPLCCCVRVFTPERTPPRTLWRAAVVVGAAAGVLAGAAGIGVALLGPMLKLSGLDWQGRRAITAIVTVCSLTPSLVYGLYATDNWRLLTDNWVIFILSAVISLVGSLIGELILWFLHRHPRLWWILAVWRNAVLIAIAAAGSAMVGVLWLTTALIFGSLLIAAAVLSVVMVCRWRAAQMRGGVGGVVSPRTMLRRTQVGIGDADVGPTPSGSFTRVGPSPDHESSSSEAGRPTLSILGTPRTPVTARLRASPGHSPRFGSRNHTPRSNDLTAARTPSDAPAGEDNFPNDYGPRGDLSDGGIDLEEVEVCTPRRLAADASGRGGSRMDDSWGGGWNSSRRSMLATMPDVARAADDSSFWEESTRKNLRVMARSGEVYTRHLPADKGEESSSSGFSSSFSRTERDTDAARAPLSPNTGPGGAAAPTSIGSGGGRRARASSITSPTSPYPPGARASPRSAPALAPPGSGGRGAPAIEIAPLSKPGSGRGRSPMLGNATPAFRASFSGVPHTAMTSPPVIPMLQPPPSRVTSPATHSRPPLAPQSSRKNLSAARAAEPEPQPDEAEVAGAEGDEAAQRARRMRIGVKRFNRNADEGLAFLEQNGLLAHTAEAYAQFFRSNEELFKIRIGDVLGGAKEFELAVLAAFEDTFDYRGLTLDEGLRQFLSTFRLPGEAQKIDRLMQGFAERYHGQNPTVFAHSDTVYVLAFGLIMLNTDLHSPSIKRKMTLDQFVSNMRGIDNGKDVPRALLEGLYASISTNEIRMDPDCDPTYKDKPDKAGYLKKLGTGALRRKNRRWFLLSGSCLYYFADENSLNRPKGIIPLENIVAEPVSRDPGEVRFVLRHPDGTMIKAAKYANGRMEQSTHHSFILLADDPEERAEWVAAIDQNVARDPFYLLLKRRKELLDAHRA